MSNTLNQLDQIYQQMMDHLKENNWQEFSACEKARQALFQQWQEQNKPVAKDDLARVKSILAQNHELLSLINQHQEEQGKLILASRHQANKSNHYTNFN